VKNVNGYCVPMEEALTPDQCEDMNHFLSMLVKYDGIAREYGKTLDLGVFMKEYRGVDWEEERQLREGGATAWLIARTIQRYPMRH